MAENNGFYPVEKVLAVRQRRDTRSGKVSNWLRRYCGAFLPMISIPDHI